MEMAFDPHASGALRLLIHFALTLWFATDIECVWRGICGQLALSQVENFFRDTLYPFSNKISNKLLRACHFFVFLF
jgi:hypothetical protein